MPPRKKIETMPPELKAWLDEELVRRGFGDYVQLAADLRAKGADVSKSGLQRYGSQFEADLANMRIAGEQARAVIAANPDEDDSMSQALMRMTQHKVFEVLKVVQIDPEKMDLGKLTLQVSRLVRASLPMKKYAAEVRAKAEQRMKEVEAEAKAMKGESRDIALAMLEKVRAVYEGAL